MLKLSIIFLFCIFAHTISAQTYLIPHVDFVNLRIRGGAMVDKWYLGAQGDWETGGAGGGAGIGFDVRQYFKKIYLQVGFTHSENMPSLYFVNTNPQNMFPNQACSFCNMELAYGGTSGRFLRLAMPTVVGTTLKQSRCINLRGFVGFMPVHRFSKRSYIDWNPDPNSPNYIEIREMVAISKLTKMHKPFEFHVLAGLGVDIWKFSVDVRRSVSLTDLAHDIQFEGKTYPFSWKGDQVMVSIGWKFRIDKNRPRKHKKNSYF
jgi:hypothetical protein